MLGVFLYLISICLVFWAYWFFIYKKSPRFITLLDIQLDKNDLSLVYFQGTLNTQEVNHTLIVLDYKRWKFYKGELFKDIYSLEKNAVEQLRNKSGIPMVPFEEQYELPFPLIFEIPEFQIPEDCILVVSGDDHSIINLIRNSIKINSFRINGLISSGMKRVYLKNDQLLLMSYVKQSKSENLISIFILNLRTGNLAGEADL
jgi:hypothetical protein